MGDYGAFVMNLKSKFLTLLTGDWITDKLFKLSSNLEYQSEILGGKIIIPKGFVTDFASVPRIPIIYMLFGDRAHHESVPHDFLYQTHQADVYTNESVAKVCVSKSMADKVFLEAMKARGKSNFIAKFMYFGVLIGGYSSYKNGIERFKKLKKLSEKNSA